MISRWSSPIPAIRVCPVSGFEVTRKVGSSSPNFLRAIPIFSWSAFVFGSIDRDTTGSAKLIGSKTIGWASSQKVCEVKASFKPTAAAISPAKTFLTSSLLFACRRTIRPSLSLFPVVELYIYEPDSIVPE